MGYMRHHAIVVTSWKGELLKRAHKTAVELGMSVSGITDEVTNGYCSFLVAPDGSKEGWTTSDNGDAQRAQLLDWLDAQRYDDDSTPLEWVVVQFGDDDLNTRIVIDSDQRRRDSSAEADDDTFTYQELRITLTAFAKWLLKDEFSEGREVELVDQFIQETTA